MLAISVLPSKQGNHIRCAMAHYLEVTLKQKGQRILIADTSVTDEFV